MVFSRIDSNVVYPELRKVYKEDLDQEAELYELELENEDITVALGTHRRVANNDNLVFFPIYKINPNNKAIQIGVYELPKRQLPRVLDEDGDVDIDLLGEPLLFPSVSQPKAQPKAQPEAQAQAEAQAQTSGKPTWVAEYLGDGRWRGQEPHFGGDSLFAAVRDALENVGRLYSVSDLRRLVGQQATEQIYREQRHYREVYTAVAERVNAKLRRIVAENDALKGALNEAIDHGEQAEIVAAARKLKERFLALKREKKDVDQLLKETSFMKPLTTFEKFRTFIRSDNIQNFAVQEWMVAALERGLNIKLVFLSSENQKEGDLGNVLLCGEQSTTLPDLYVVVEKWGKNHHRLLNYQGLKAFTCDELPGSLKERILVKCMEKMAKDFLAIPYFAERAVELKRARRHHSTPPIPAMMPQIVVKNLACDPRVVLVLGPAAASSPWPGRANGERIDRDFEGVYFELARDKHWRKKLDDAWAAEFDLDGHKWQTVAHYMCGARFAKANPSYSYQFSLDSASPMAKDLELAYAGALGAAKPAHIETDMAFHGQKHAAALKNALLAKFTQHQELQQLLANTHTATLAKYIPNEPLQSYDMLMFVRSKLNKLK